MVSNPLWTVQESDGNAAENDGSIAACGTTTLSTNRGAGGGLSTWISPNSSGASRNFSFRKILETGFVAILLEYKQIERFGVSASDKIVRLQRNIRVWGGVCAKWASFLQPPLFRPLLQPWATNRALLIYPLFGLVTEPPI